MSFVRLSSDTGDSDIDAAVVDADADAGRNETSTKKDSRVRG